MNIRQERLSSGNHFRFCLLVRISPPSKGFTSWQGTEGSHAHPLRAAGILSRLSAWKSCLWVNWCPGAVFGNYLMYSFIEQTAEIERERDERVRKVIWNREKCSRKKIFCKELDSEDSEKSTVVSQALGKALLVLWVTETRTQTIREYELFIQDKQAGFIHFFKAQYGNYTVILTPWPIPCCHVSNTCSTCPSMECAVHPSVSFWQAPLP